MMEEKQENHELPQTESTINVTEQFAVNVETEPVEESPLFVNEPIDISRLPQLQLTDFTGLNREYLYVRLVGAIIFFAFLSAVGVLVYFQSELAIWHIYLPLGLLFAFQLTVMILGFKKKGYHMREHDISYQTGLIFHKITTVPLKRIQHSEVSRGPLQRLFDLATVKIYTAGGQQSDLSIPGLTPTDAKKIAEYINKIVREHAEG